MAVTGNIAPDAVVRYVLNSWVQLKDSRKELEENWIASVLCYLGTHPKASQKWIAQARAHGFGDRFIPLTWSLIQTLSAQVCQAIFAPPDWCRCEPSPMQRGRADYDDLLAEQVRDHLKYYWSVLKCKKQVKQAVVQALLTGNVPLTVSWYREHAADYPVYAAAMQQYDEMARQQWAMYQQTLMQWQIEEQMAMAVGAPPPARPRWSSPTPPTIDPVIAFEGPRIEVDDIFNFVMDDDASGGQPLRIKRSWKRKAWLENFARPNAQGYSIYENLDLVQEMDLTAVQRETDTFLAERAKAFGIELAPKRGVELFEAQGDMIIPTGNGPDVLVMSYIATVANRRTLIRFEPTYLWSGRVPTIMGQIFPVPGQVYGEGIGGKIMPSQDLYNKRANQITDAVDVAINPEFKVWDDGVYNPKSATGPGKKHVVADPENLVPVAKNLQGVQVGFADLSAIKAELQQLSRSYNPYTPSGAEETATEVERNTSIIGADFAELVEMFEESLIEPVMMNQIDHWAVFGQGVNSAPVLQQGKVEWVSLTPEAFRKGWIVKIDSHKRAELRRQMIQNLFMAIEMFGGNPEFAVFLNKIETMKLVWTEIELPGKEKCIIDPTQMTADQMAMAMFQQVMAQQQQAMMALPQGAAGGDPSAMVQRPPEEGAAEPAGQPQTA